MKFNNFNKLQRFLQLGGLNLSSFVMPSILALGYVLSAMYSVYLLFPLANGIIKNDFKGLKLTNEYVHLFKYAPDFFQSSNGLFILLILWVLIVTAIKNIFHYYLLFLTQLKTKKATARLTELLVEKCLSYEKTFYDKNTTSYLLSVLTKSTKNLEFRFKSLQEFLTQLILTIAFLGIMLNISWKLTTVAIIVFPLMTLFIQKIVQEIQKLAQERFKSEQAIYDKILNIIYCMPIIKSFVKEKYELQEFRKVSEDEIRHTSKYLKISSLISPIEDMGAIAAILMIALGLAVIMRLDQGLTAAGAIVFFYLAMRISPTFHVFNRLMSDISNTVSDFVNIENILNQDLSSKVIGGERKFSGLRGNIEFKDLVFSYIENDVKVLNKVTFVIPKGSTVAIVGPSGSGKSTLISLLLRFYDCPKGSIYINDQDIRDFDIASLREYMGYISQEALLFNDTVKNNIIYGSSTAVSDNFLQELGKKVQINELIENLPKKYDTYIGEKGSRLSGGERQRLSIARAMAKDAEILIMDEATSALDSATESKISEELFEMSKEKTLIIIAHRLSTIKRAQKVVYMDQGRVVETGTFEELIEKKGAFFSQWEAQKI